MKYQKWILISKEIEIMHMCVLNKNLFDDTYRVDDENDEDDDQR